MNSMLMIIFAVLGLACVFPMSMILNRMPARCFCDYNEAPEERHNAPRITSRQKAVCSVILAAVFSLIANRFGCTVQSAALCLLCVTLMMIALSDLRYCIIPDELLIAAAVFAVIQTIPGIIEAQNLRDRLSPLTGALLGAGIIFAINLLGRILYKKDALGMGDLKLMAVCGIACGDVGIVIGLFAGILTAGFWFAAGMALKRVRSDEYLPLGPFLVAGTVFFICFQPAVERLLAWYISLIHII